MHFSLYLTDYLLVAVYLLADHTACNANYSQSQSCVLHDWLNKVNIGIITLSVCLSVLLSETMRSVHCG